MPVSSVVNDDVLYYIASLCHKQKALPALTLTCRTLNRDFAKLLLGEVSLYSEPQIVGFLSWISADLPRRAPFLRGFHIAVKSPVPFLQHTGQRLTFFFVHLQSILKIEHLSLMDAEIILASHPDLPLATARLRTLTDLSLTNVGHHSRWLLRFTESRLHRARIVLGNARRDFPEEENTLAHLLEAHSSSLNKIQGLDHFGLWTPTMAGGPQYTNVTHLSLDEIEIPITSHYVHTFPNLQTLVIIGEQHMEEMWDGASIVQQRETNIAAQERTGNWVHLRNYDGPLLALYAFGLTFHIPILRVTGDPHRLDLAALRATLEDARPVTLDLSVNGTEWFRNPVFVDILSSARSVQELTMSMDITVEDYDDNDWDFKPVMDATAEILNALERLVSFSFKLDCRILDASIQAIGDDRRPSEIITQGIDYLVSADRLRVAGKGGHTVRMSMENEMGPGGPQVLVRMGPGVETVYEK